MRYKTYLKKTLSLLFACVFVFGVCFSTPAFAASSNVSDLEQQKKAVQESINKKKRELESFKAEKKETEEYLILLTQNMDLVREKINVLQAQIDELQAQITEKENSIKALEVKIAENQKLFDIKKEEYYERLRVLYISGSVSNLEVLLDSGDFSSLLTRAQLVSSISKQDQKALEDLENTLKEIKKDQDALEKDKEILVSSKSELDSSMTQLQSEKDSLNDSIAKSRALAESLQGSISDAEEDIKEDEASKQALASQIERVKNEYSNSNGGSFNGSGNFEVGDGVTTGSMTHPCPDRYSVSVYWPRYKSGKWHGGVDLACGSSAPPIYAADGGLVVAAGWDTTGYGNRVMIYHSNGLYTLYGHASALYVSEGQTVTKGQVIAKVGNTGNSYGNHLHFEVRHEPALSSRDTYDPANYLPYL